MRTGEPKRISLILILLIAAMLIMLFAPAYVVKADDGHGHNHHDDDGNVTIDNVLTGGDVITGDNSIRGGIAVSGSDMEIADSLATHSILFGLWQGTHTNPYAEADRLDNQGNHQAAAEMRCSTRKYKKVYGKDCINDVIYTPSVEIPPEEPDDLYEAVYARLMDLEAQRTVDAGNVQKAAQRADAAVKRANQAQIAIQEQVPVDDGRSRRAQAREAYLKAMEGDE